MIEKSVRCFKGPEKYNCAQAILRGFEDVFDVTEDDVKAHKKLGFGRIDNGTCGAPYAAATLLDNPQDRASLRQRFQERVGTLRCKKIRKAKRISCEQCVRITAEILNDLRPKDKTA